MSIFSLVAIFGIIHVYFYSIMYCVSFWPGKHFIIHVIILLQNILINVWLLILFKMKCSLMCGLYLDFFTATFKRCQRGSKNRKRLFHYAFGCPYFSRLFLSYKVIRLHENNRSLYFLVIFYHNSIINEIINMLLSLHTNPNLIDIPFIYVIVIVIIVYIFLLCLLFCCNLWCSNYYCYYFSSEGVVVLLAIIATVAVVGIIILFLMLLSSSSSLLLSYHYYCNHYDHQHYHCYFFIIIIINRARSSSNIIV